MILRYPVAIIEKNGDFVVEVRDLPEVVTSGENRDEALVLAADAMAVSLAGRIKDGEPVPVPSSAQPGEVLVKPDDFETA